MVRNVKNKAVSSTMPKPNSVSDISSIELDDKLFIRDGESYVKFWIDD
mgnify:FL=1